MSGNFGPALRWAVSANAAANLINLLGLVIFARLLGTDVFGRYGVTVVSIELIALLFNFGFNQAVIRHRGDALIFSAALALIIIQSFALLAAVSLAILVGSVLGLTFLTAGIPVALLVIAKILTFYTTLAYAPLESSLDYRPIALSKAAAAMAALAMGVAGTYLLTDPSLVLPIRDVTASLLSFALLLPKSPFRWRISTDMTALSRVWRFVRPIWHLNLLERTALRGDYAIVSQIVEASTFGVYYAVRSLIDGALGFILNPIQTAVYAHYCSMTRVLETFRAIVKQWLLSVTLLTLVIVLVFAVTTVDDWIVGLMYGTEWRRGGALLAGLSAYAIAMIVFEHSKVVSIAVQSTRPAILARLLQLVLISAFLVPLTTEFGLAGAASTTAVGAVCMSVIATVLLYRPRDKRLSTGK